MSRILEQLVARGRRERKPTEQRDVAYNLAELSTNPDFHATMISKGVIKALLHLIQQSSDVEALQLSCLCFSNIAVAAKSRSKIMEECALTPMIEYITNKDSSHDIVATQYIVILLGNMACDQRTHDKVLSLNAIDALTALINPELIYCGLNAAFALTNLALNPDCREPIVEAGAIPRLIALMCSQEIKVQLQALACLRRICIDLKYHITVIEEGILDPLILMAGSTVPNVQQEVADAIYTLSTQTENKTVISDRALSTIISMSLSGNPLVEEHACGTLANLMEVEELHDKLIEERGLPVILALSVTKESNTKAEACRCLSHLTTNLSIHQLLIDSGVLQPFSQALISDHPLCQRYAALGIANLATTSKYQEKIVEIGVIHPLIRLSQAFDSEMDARRYAALAIANLAAMKVNHTALLEADCLLSLFSLASTADGTSQYFVAYALSNLASNEYNHARMVEEGGIQPIITLACSQDTDVHQQAVAALRGLAVYHPNKTKIVQEGGLEPLILLLESDDVDVVRQVCYTVSNLTASRDAAYEVAKSGALPLLIYHCQSEDKQIAQQSCAILGNLAEINDLQALLFENGAIQALVAMMRSPYVLVQREASRALANIVPYEASHRTVIEHGGHLLFIAFLLSPDDISQYTGAVGVCNLSNSAALHGLLLKSGILEPLLSIVRAREIWDDTKKLAILSAAHIASCTENHTAIVTEGYPEAFISLSDAADDQVRHFAAYALSRIAANEYYRDYITERGGLKSILSLSRVEDVWVYQQLIHPLCSLSFVDANKEDICAHGGMQVLIYMLLSDNLHELCSACCAIANLAEALGNGIRLGQPDVLSNLVAALQSIDSSVKKEAARAIGNIAVSPDNAMAILEYDALTPLIGMFFESDDIFVKRMSGFAIANIALVIKNLSNTICINSSHAAVWKQLTDTVLNGSMDLLNRGLGDTNMDTEVLSYTLLFVANIASSYSTHPPIQSNPSIALDKYCTHTDPKCFQHSILVIGNLCTSDEFVRGTVHPSLLKVLIASAFPGIKHVRLQAIAALHGISALNLYRHELIQMHVLEPLILAVNSGDYLLQHEALGAICNLSLTPENRKFLVTGGCIIPLLKVAASKDARTLKTILSCLSNMAKDVGRSTQQIMLDQGVVACLCTLVLHRDVYVRLQVARAFVLFSGSIQNLHHLKDLDVMHHLVTFMTYKCHSSSGNECMALQALVQCFSVLATANFSLESSFHSELQEKGVVHALIKVCQSTAKNSAMYSIASPTSKLSNDTEATLPLTLYPTPLEVCVETRRAVAFTLCNLAQNDHQIPQLFQSGVLTSLISLLSDDDLDTHCQTSSALSNMAKWSYIQTELRLLDAFQFLMSLVARTDSVFVQRKVCGILYHMTKSENGPFLLSPQADIDPLLQLVHCKDGFVVHQCCLVLANLAEHEQNGARLIRNGVLQHLKFALRRISEETKSSEDSKLLNLMTQRQSIRAIANMAASEERNSDLDMSGAFDLLLHAAHSSDSIVYRCAAMGLSNLSRMEKNIGHVLHGDTISFLKEFCRSIDQSGVDSAAHEYALCALANLASYRIAQVEFAGQDGIDIFLRCIHSSSQVLRNISICGIANLASFEENHDTIANIRLDEVDVRESVTLPQLALRLVAGKDISYHYYAISALCGISCHVATRESLANANTCTLLLSLFISSEERIRHLVLKCFCNLSLSKYLPIIADKILATISLHTIVRYLHSKFPCCQQFAALFLGNLVSSTLAHVQCVASVEVLAHMEKSWHVSDAETRRCITLGLCNLVLNGPVYVSILMRHNGIPIILSQINAADSEDQEMVLSALLTLCQQHDCHKALFDHGILKEIEIAVKAPSCSSIVIAQVSWILYNLSLSDAYKCLIAVSNTLQCLANLHDRFSKKILYAICANLTECQDTHEIILRLIDATNTVSCDLKSRYDKQTAQADTDREAIKIVANLASNPLNHEKLLALSWPDLVIDAIKSRLGVEMEAITVVALLNFCVIIRDKGIFSSEQIQVLYNVLMSSGSRAKTSDPFIALVIGCICTHSQNREYFLNAPLLSMLTNLIDRKLAADWETRCYALFAILKLAEDDECFVQICTEEHANVLIRLIVEEVEDDSCNRPKYAKPRTMMMVMSMRILHTLLRSSLYRENMSESHCNELIRAIEKTAIGSFAVLDTQLESASSAFYLSQITNARILFLPIVPLLVNLCGSSDALVACHACGTVANLSENLSLHEMMKSACALQISIQLFRHTDNRIRRQASRAVANLLQTNAAHRIIVSDTIRLSLLTEFFTFDDTECQSNASLAFYRLCANNFNHPTLVACPILIKKLQKALRDSEIADIQRHCTAALERLAACTNNHSILIQQNVINDAVLLLRHADTVVQCMSVMTIRHLTSNTSMRWETFVTRKGSTLLFELCCQSQDTHVLLQCAYLLSCLCEEKQILKEFLQSDEEPGIFDVIEALCKAFFLDDKSVCTSIGQCMSTLLVQFSVHQETCVRDFPDSFFKYICAFMSHSEYTFAAEAAKALGNMALTEQNHVMIFKYELLKPIRILLSSPSSDCCYYAVRVLHHLARHSKAHEDILQSQVLSPLIKLLDNAECEGLCAMTVCNLASCKHSCSKYLGQAGAIPALLKTVDPDNASILRKDVLMYSLMALCNLTLDRDNQLELLQCGRSVECMTHYIRSEDHKHAKFACMVLANAAAHPKNRITLGKAISFSHILNVCSSKRSECVYTAAIALYNISCDRQTPLLLVASKAENVLIPFAASEDHEKQHIKLISLMTLCNLAANVDTRHAAARNGGLQTFIRMANASDHCLQGSQETNRKIQQYACLTLSNLACDSVWRQQIVTHGGLTALLVSAKSSEKEVIRLQYPLIAMSNIAADSANHMALLEYGAMQFFMRVLKDTIDATLQLLGSLLIANVASNIAHGDQLVKIGATDSLVSMIYAQDPSMRTLAISSLCQILACSSYNRIKLFQSNVLSALMEASAHQDCLTKHYLSTAFCLLSLEAEASEDMIRKDAISVVIEYSHYTNDPFVIWKSCSTLANLLEGPDLETELLQLHILPIIVALLSYPDIDVQREAVRAVANAILNIINHSQILCLGAIAKIIHVCSISTDREIQYYSAVALRNLSPNACASREIASNDGIHLLLTLLNINDTNIIRQSIFALRDIASNSEIQPIFLQKKGVETLVSFIDRASTPLQSIGMATLRHVSLHEKLKKSVADRGALHIISRCIPHREIAETKQLSLLLDLYSQSIGLLANLSENKCNQIAIVERKLMLHFQFLSPSQKRQSALHRINAEIEQDLARILANLCCHGRNQVAVYAQGGYACLISLIESEQDVTQMYSAIALHFLSRNPEIRIRLVQNSLYSPFLRLATSELLLYRRTTASAFASFTMHEENRLLLIKDGVITLLLRLCVDSDLQVQRDTISAVANIFTSCSTFQNVASIESITLLLQAGKTQDTVLQRQVARALLSLSMSKVCVMETHVINALFALMRCVDTETMRFSAIAMCVQVSCMAEENRLTGLDRIARSLTNVLSFADTGLQQYAAIAFAFLVLRGKMRAIERDMTGPIVHLIQFPEANVQLSGCLALHAMILHEESKCKLDAIGIESFVRLLDSEDIHCVQAAIYCLGTMAEDRDTLPSLVNANMIPSLVQNLKHSDRETQKFGGYIFALLVDQDTLFHEIFVNEGGVEAVIALALIPDSECQDYASFALAHVASNAKYQLLLAQCGALKPLVSMISIHAEPRYYAMLALLELAGNYETHLNIAEEGGVQALIRMTRSKSTNETIQSKASIRLGQIANNIAKLSPKQKERRKQ